MALADRGHKGVEPSPREKRLLSHTPGLPGTLKKLAKRRQVTKPTIGQMKTSGQLGREQLKGAGGDAIHAVLCGVGHNIELIVRHLWVPTLTLLAARICITGSAASA